MRLTRKQRAGLIKFANERNEIPQCDINTNTVNSLIKKGLVVNNSFGGTYYLSSKGRSVLILLAQDQPINPTRKSITARLITLSKKLVKEWEEVRPKICDFRLDQKVLLSDLENIIYEVEECVNELEATRD